MDFIQELVEASKVSKKTAHAVYHRDYERTKNKPYRKYDPKKYERSKGTEEEEVSDDEELEEGMFDFIKGAAGHVGNSIKQGVQNTVAAGKAASAVGDLKNSIATLAKLLVSYDQLKTKQPQQQQAPQQAPAAPQVVRSKRTSPEDQHINQKAQPASSAVPSAFRTTEKPRARMGQHGLELQFSSYLMSLDDNDFVTEGVWDFVKGAAGHVAKSAAAPIRAGQEASAVADFAKTKAAANKKVVEIVQLLQQIGPGAIKQFQSFIQSNPELGDNMRRRLLSVVMSSAKKMGVQLQ